MRDKMYRMTFEEKEFNALMQHLDLFEDDSLFRKINKYATVVTDNDGTPFISVKFFAEEIERLCWFLMELLPKTVDDDYFTPLVQEVKERNAAYRRMKEAEERALYDGIKEALLLDPKTSGAAIARKLKVPPSRVYSTWDKVRKDIEDEALAKAAQEVDQAILDQLPAPEECTHVFSEEFEEKMAALLSPNAE